MANILAIETDPERRRLLARLVREHVNARITIVASVKAAILASAEQPPDLILAPTLLSPQDSKDLTAHVKRLHAAPHVQMLTMAALDMLVGVPREVSRGRGIFKRRSKTPDLQYDPRMVVARIADGLDRARAARAEHEVALADAAWRAEAVSSTATTDLVLATRTSEVLGFRQRLDRQQERERRCARRNTPGDVPWLSAIKLSNGLGLDLLNISRSGLLVEAGVKLAPGTTLELQLNGPSTSRVVKARFVRSEVARVDPLGVRYYAAAAFETELDLLLEREEPVKVPNRQRELGALLATVLAETDRGEPAPLRFARGLCELVRARDILVRNAPMTTADEGSESIYFHVKGEGPSRAILQVIFERDQEITASEFRLLKTGAVLAAALLELEEPEVPELLSADELTKATAKAKGKSRQEQRQYHALFGPQPGRAGPSPADLDGLNTLPYAAAVNGLETDVA